MCKSGTAVIIKSIFCGMVAGMILGASLCCMIKNQTKVKRKAGKAIHAMGDFIEQVPSMFK